jgi:hypothetical protein
LCSKIINKASISSTCFWCSHNHWFDYQVKIFGTNKFISRRFVDLIAKSF